MSDQARNTAYRVALHYAKLDFAVTPAHHAYDEKEERYVCRKHPTVRWKETDVQAGLIVGPTKEEAEIRDYWLGPRADPLGADICIHTKTSNLIVVDCDRSWKKIVVKDERGIKTTQQVFVDGLAQFLAFIGDDVGTELMSRSKRGLHFFYRVNSELAAQIRNRNGWLPGVDVRGGGASSGGVTIETNGVCPHRGWVRGVPRIEITDAHPEGEIVGLEDCPEIEFDDDGKCISGLPQVVVSDLPGGNRVEGLRAPLETLLQALLVASQVVKPSASNLRKQHRQAKRTRERLMRTATTHSSSSDARRCADARPSAALRPYQFQSRCTCSRCTHFCEAVALLSWIPPEVNYEAWRNVLWGLSDLLGGSLCGDALGAEWSNLSIIQDRCDPDLASATYRSDRRQIQELLGDESGRNIGAAFLRGIAILCGAPELSISTGHLRLIAEQHDNTLVAECGIDTTAVLRRELDVFEDLADPRINGEREQDTVPDDGDAGDDLLDFVHRSGIEPTYKCLGVSWGPLSPGTLDELLPPSPALLHYPTRRGLTVANPYDGDTLIPMQDVGMLVAPGSSGKTMFFLQLLVAVATGTEFLGKFRVGTAAKHRPVVMLCAEDRREQVLRRLQLIFREVLPDLSPKQRREAETRIHIVSLAGVGSERLFLKTASGVPITSDGFREFARTIAKIKPALVVCDPLTRLLSGNVDLSSEVGTAWVATLEFLVRNAAEPIAVWFAHHSSKASRRSRLTREDDEPDARGTTGLFDGVRIEGYIMPLANSEAAFRIRKNNHGPRMEFKDREMLLRGHHGILRAFTAEELDERVAANRKAKAEARDLADDETLRRILVALALNPDATSRDTLRGIVGRGKESFSRAFATLSGARHGRPPMVTQEKKGGRFTLNGAVIAAESPDLVDQGRRVVVVGRWCSDDWPRGIRDKNAVIPIESMPGGYVEPSAATHQQSDPDQEEPGGDEMGATSSSTGPGPSKEQSSAPKGDSRSGLMGRLRTPPSLTQPSPISRQESVTQSDPSRIAVRSDREQSRSAKGPSPRLAIPALGPESWGCNTALHARAGAA